MKPPVRGWLGRMLFGLGCILAGLLVAVVMLAPLVDERDGEEDWQRVVAVFARDAVLRRTCLASAAGLVVSACVFFKRGQRGGYVGEVTPPRRPRSSGIAGA